MPRTLNRFLVLSGVIACGGSGESPPELPECTPDGQEIIDNELTTVQFDVFEDVPCDNVLISSAAELDLHFGGTIPPEIPEVVFTRDRLLLALSNPQVQFVVDDGAGIVVGEELRCQGIAPHCIAHVLKNTVQDALAVIACPYRGPDPCLAP